VTANPDPAERRDAFAAVVSQNISNNIDRVIWQIKETIRSLTFLASTPIFSLLVILTEITSN
jgi:hypothetical protein